MSNLKNLTLDQVRSLVEYVDGDGHTVFDRKALVEACAWPSEMADLVCKVIRSDLNRPKGTVFGTRGEAIAALYGWYGLEVLSRVAAALGVKYEIKIGRGFQARAITEELLKHLEESTTAAGEMNDV